MFNINKITPFLYLPELEIKETTDNEKSVSYLDLLHNIDFGSGIKPFNKYKYFH